MFGFTLAVSQIFVHYPKLRITYNSDDGNKFAVHKPDGSTRIFKQSDRGIFYLDNAEYKSETALVTTVAQNKTKYTTIAYSHAKAARNLQIQIGHPELTEFLHLIDNNILPNCTITQEDAINTTDIFGRDIGSVKGKTTRPKPKIVTSETIHLPWQIILKYTNISLCVDIVYVNRNPLFISVCKK